MSEKRSAPEKELTFRQRCAGVRKQLGKTLAEKAFRERLIRTGHAAELKVLNDALDILKSYQFFAASKEEAQKAMDDIEQCLRKLGFLEAFFSHQTEQQRAA